MTERLPDEAGDNAIRALLLHFFRRTKPKGKFSMDEDNFKFYVDAFCQHTGYVGYTRLKLTSAAPPHISPHLRELLQDMYEYDGESRFVNAYPQNQVIGESRAEAVANFYFQYKLNLFHEAISDADHE